MESESERLKEARLRRRNETKKRQRAEETEEERAARLEKRRKYEAARRVHSDEDGSSSSSASRARAADQRRNETKRRQRAAGTEEERARRIEQRRQSDAARRAARLATNTTQLERKADPAVPRTAQCVVPVCHSRSAPSSILYPLPAEPTQRQAWIDFVRGCPCGGGSDWNPPTNEISFVCSLHFAVRCFWFQRRRGCTVGYSKRLRSGAVPTLYPVEEECSSAANANSPDDTAERLASSDVEDAEGRTCNSLASIQSVAGQDRGHHAIDQDAVRRLARLARFELIFPKDVSTQCSVKMASKAASCDVRTVSKSVQCSV
ncbi:uncharacterized protein LOC119454029 isoform X2 [Dermacentor silvarum]|uniref:uncharacterized protein LOC119454029 isoform X2 n=1 Tax=Dermacentor silvarum TaxID=543639 RepID=UPI0021008D96|nr:uncharacterized protein LOC119454029 isoform X2 [Dermacentor silvarum]